MLGWLPDLARWAQVIAHFLAPGGVFYLVEAHPLLQIFDDRVTEPALRLLYPYFHGPEPVREEHAGCYSAPDAPIKSVEHVWLHTRLGPRQRARPRRAPHHRVRRVPVPELAVLPVDGAGRRRLVAPARGSAAALGRGSLPLMFSLKATAPA